MTGNGESGPFFFYFYIYLPGEKNLFASPFDFFFFWYIITSMQEKRKTGISVTALLLFLLFAAPVLFYSFGADDPYVGFRASRYGIVPFPDTEYWSTTGLLMSEKMNGAPVGAVWIVGVFIGNGTCQLNFPSPGGNYRNIDFLTEDQNEAYLTWFDQNNISVWLQVEPGDASVVQLANLVLNRYKHHPCVTGFGVDVEWFRWDQDPEGIRVGDTAAQRWRDVVASHNPGYQLFLKHWLMSKMPPTYRKDLFFIDDSQGFSSLEAMTQEFQAWGEYFAPNPVGFQVGYEIDRPWWNRLPDPFRDIGQAILDKVSNTRGLFWADFTLREVFWPSSFYISPGELNFGSTSGGISTSGQDIAIFCSSGCALEWRAVTDEGWLMVTPGSGRSGDSPTVSVNPAGLAPGSYSGTVTFSDFYDEYTTRTVEVNLLVQGTAESVPVFGEFSSPGDGTTGISGALPVTGWALDDIETERIKIFYSSGGNRYHLDNAVFIDGARPDVAQLYPGYPFHTRSGWGYMLLTNFLPNGGNGTFILEAEAQDREGNTVILGTRTISCDNAHAKKPFGTIDLPAQGGMVSGSHYDVYGWVLTPNPNRIPVDGSTIRGYIDDTDLGQGVYNIYRQDIAALFPGYANSEGAVAYFKVDTNAFTNGRHLLYWVASDSAGNSEGVGSRYIFVQNAGGQRNTLHAQKTSRRTPAGARNILPPGTFNRSSIPAKISRRVTVKRGFPGTGPMAVEEVYANRGGEISLPMKELSRLEIHLEAGAAGYSGFLSAAGRLSPLPTGSRLDSDKGVFSWYPGPGYIGDYRLVFIAGEVEGAGTFKKTSVKITVEPKFSPR